MLSRLLLPRRLGSLPPRLGPRLSCALASPPSSICHLNSNECINEVSGGRFRYHSSPSLDVPRPKKITTALPPTPLKESKPTSKGKAKEEEIPKAKVEGNSKGEAKRDEGKGLLTSSMSNEIPKRRGRPPKVEVAEKIAMETPNVNPDNKSNIPSIEELPEKKKRGRKPKETSATEKEKEEEGVATKRRRSRSTAIIIDWSPSFPLALFVFDVISLMLCLFVMLMAEGIARSARRQTQRTPTSAPLVLPHARERLPRVGFLTFLRFFILLSLLLLCNVIVTMY